MTQASKGFDAGFAAWRKIIKYLTPAYLIKFGGDDGTKLKVHFLHRGLLGIAKSVEPGLSEEGLADFLDYICPCGKKHKPEAVRKSEERLTKFAWNLVLNRRRMNVPQEEEPLSHFLFGLSAR